MSNFWCALQIGEFSCLRMKEWAVFFILRQQLLRDGKFSPAGKARKTSEVISRRGPRITSLSVLFAGGWKGCWKERFGAGYLPAALRGALGKALLASPRITLQPLLAQTRHGCLERQGLGQCYSNMGKALLASPRITLQPSMPTRLRGVFPGADSRGVSARGWRGGRGRGRGRRG